MGIFIQNIDANPRPRGKHRYHLRINGQVICEFDHFREKGLATCLRKAAEAVSKARDLDAALALHALGISFGYDDQSSVRGAQDGTPKPAATQPGPDGCELCHGTRGGVPGNENRIDGRRVCDYCHADMMLKERS